MTQQQPDANTERWDAFVEWARRFDGTGYIAGERAYKLPIGEALAAAREALLNESLDWRDRLREAIEHPNNNLTKTNWRMHSAFVALLDSDEAAVETALRQLWAYGDGPLRERVRGFVEHVDIPQPESFASFLLMALDIRQYPFYRNRVFHRAYRYTGYPYPAEKTEYEHAIAFMDEFTAQARARGLHIRDRLDAQTHVWWIANRRYTPDNWPQGIADALDAYRKSDGDPHAAAPALAATPSEDGEDASDDDATAAREPDWAAVGEELLWSRGELEGIAADLEHKGQMIFYGPPGTGKTYAARRIAREYAEATGGRADLVQFHPSYAYEDFVEGYRPVLRDGQAAFELRRGPLRGIADEAAANPDAKYVLVIDELNRGNVAKVFGELYFLLEYREEAIRLQYGGGDDRFALPKNLLFVCTMNTADRSIALLDAALRRRFWFVPFFPGEPPIEGLLRRWLAANRPEMAERVAALVELANERLADRDAAIGPSHFMDRGLDEARLRRVWERAVVPYVEEQCYGDDAKLASLRYDSLTRELDRRNGGADAGDGADAEDAPLPNGDAGDA